MIGRGGAGFSCRRSGFEDERGVEVEVSLKAGQTSAVDVRESEDGKCNI